jgi:hypothetical protein
MKKTINDFSPKQRAVIMNLCKLKKQIDPETAETITRLINSIVDLHVYGEGA